MTSKQGLARDYDLAEKSLGVKRHVKAILSSGYSGTGHSSWMSFDASPETILCAQAICNRSRVVLMSQCQLCGWSQEYVHSTQQSGRSYLHTPLPPTSRAVPQELEFQTLRRSNSCINTNPTVSIANRKPPIATRIEARKLRVRDTVWRIRDQEARSGTVSHRSSEAAICRVDAGDAAVVCSGDAVDLLHSVACYYLANGKAIDGAENVVRGAVGVDCC